jgi:Helix-hairpin-helix motif
MKARGYLMYAVVVAAVCAAIALVLWQRRGAQEAEDARKYPPQQVVRIPTPSPQSPGTLPPGLTPVPPGSGPRLPGAGPQPGGPPVPFRTDGASRPPMMGGVTQQAVIDLNIAPVSALVTLPGITAEYAKKIVEHRPYRDRADLEAKTGLPHGVIQGLGPPAMIRSTSVEPLPIPKK